MRTHKYWKTFFAATFVFDINQHALLLHMGKQYMSTPSVGHPTYTFHGASSSYPTKSEMEQTACAEFQPWKSGRSDFV